MLSDKMLEAINEQINKELYSSYLYMSMAAWCDAEQLSGFAHWLKVQAQEEMAHALKFYNYVNERGGAVKMKAIEAPPTEWDSPLALAEAVLAHEQKVTGMIYALMDLAQEERDHASISFLQWFIDEQVEEEASVSEVVGKLKMVEKTHGGLYMVDKELGGRVFNMPTGVTI